MKIEVNETMVRLGEVFLVVLILYIIGIAVGLTDWPSFMKMNYPDDKHTGYQRLNLVYYSNNIGCWR